MSDQTKSAVPSLTLEPFEEAVPAAPAPQPEQPAVVEETPLTPEERKAVDEFAARIDLSKSEQILSYGAAAQKKIADFSETALKNVRAKDLGEVGEMITSLVGELKGFEADEQEKGGLFGWFKGQGSRLTAMKARYDRAEVNVERICSALEDHQVQLLKDVAMLDQMYQSNLGYFKELSMYILAGKKKLESARANELAALTAKAQQTGRPEDSQAASDYASLCDRFEKKLHDLELTRMVSIQMAPQIRLVQNNDTLMAEKIQSTLVNTIPLWKSQMVISLGLAHSQQAMEAQRAVTDMTNELLRKNAEALKQGTIATAKESERGVVDIETLKATNASLISTLDEVVKIQDEGRAKRRAAEEELGRLEGELRQKLLDIHS